MTNIAEKFNCSKICEKLGEIGQSFSSQNLLKVNQLQKNAIRLVSKWYSYSGIPRNMVQILLDDVQHFNDSILVDVKAKINCIVNNPYSSDIIKDLSLILNALEYLSSPFDNLKTEYFRLQT